VYRSSAPLPLGLLIGKDRKGRKGRGDRKWPKVLKLSMDRSIMIGRLRWSITAARTTGHTGVGAGIGGDGYFAWRLLPSVSPSATSVAI
jgi:hypothetical protein